MSSPVELPAALLARRRKTIEDYGPGPDEEGATPPVAEEPTIPPAVPETPPARTETPTPAAPTTPASEDEDEDEDMGEVDLLGELGDLMGDPATPPASDPPADPARAELEREKQRLKEERETLELDRQQLEQQRQAAGRPDVPELTSEEMSAEQVEKYKGSKAAIENFALAAVSEQINPILKDISSRLAQLEEGQQTVVQKTQRVEEAAKSVADRDFNKTVVSAVGDIRPLLKNDRFSKFLSRAPQYMPDKTLKELFTAALNSRNPTPIVSIVRAFAKSEAAAGRPLENMRIGHSTGGSEKPLRQRPSSGKLPWSERQKSWDSFRLGVMSKEKFDDIKARYEEAADKGLVDYDS